MTARPRDRYDIWNWFARRHLRTRTERGVYQSVVAAPLGVQSPYTTVYLLKQGDRRAAFLAVAP